MSFGKNCSFVIIGKKNRHQNVDSGEVCNYTTFYTVFHQSCSTLLSFPKKIDFNNTAKQCGY